MSDSKSVKHGRIPLLLLFLCSSILPLSVVSSYPRRHLLQNQNIQTFFPSASPSPPPSFSSSHSGKNIPAAVAITAASTFALSTILFFAFCRFASKRGRANPVPMDGHVSNALFWKSLDDAEAPMLCDHCNFLLRESLDGIDQSCQQVPHPENFSLKPVPNTPAPTPEKSLPPPPEAPAPPAIKISGLPPPPLPLASQRAGGPPPPPPPASKKAGGPPPPPPPASKKAGGPSPPPPAFKRTGGPPPPPPDAQKERPKLKPLHWDKVTPANAGLSMVWDKITDGSMRFDDDMMEALFGYVAGNHKASNWSSSSGSAGSSLPNNPPQIRLIDPRKSQNIAIIVRTLSVSRLEILEGLNDGQSLSADTLEKLSRISLTPEEESLISSFSGDPSQLPDAESFLFHILRSVPSAFPRIASLHFLRSIYEPEILHLERSLQTLDIACDELRTRDLFIKLLEAILKAGNRMNAGTSRGNAQAFDLTALRKLSDVKSTDGKTTLLHFVVQEVARSEGKRRSALSKSSSFRRSSSRNHRIYAMEQDEREREYMMLGLPIVGGLSADFSNVSKAATIDHDSLAGGCVSLSRRLAETRQLVLGLKEEKGDFVQEMTRFVDAAGEKIEKVEVERKRVMDKVRRTIEYYQGGVSKDKEKEAAAQSLRLFVIVRDFLAMVDQAFIDISGNLQKTKPPPAAPSSPPVIEKKAEQLPAVILASQKEERITTRFPNLPVRFLSDNTLSSSDSSEEEDGF